MQIELFAVEKPLHETLRPRGNREDVGKLGEALHQLADVVEARWSNQMIVADATFHQIWILLDTLIKTIPEDDDRDTFCSSHELALARLRALASV